MRQTILEMYVFMLYGSWERNFYHVTLLSIENVMTEAHKMLLKRRIDV